MILRLAVAMVLSLTGCDLREQERAPEENKSAVQASKAARHTLAEWSAAVGSTYRKSSSKTDSDGITEFSACFQEAADGRCVTFMFGRRDGFGKGVAFTPARSALNRHGVNEYLHSRVVLLDCGSPAVGMQARYFSKDGWIFLKRASVLADGELALDHEFANPEVRRNAQSWGVDESASWILDSGELDGLRKVAAARHVIVRLTGDKGFVTVHPKHIQDFRSDVDDILKVYTTLARATETVLPAECGATQRTNASE